MQTLKRVAIVTLFLFLCSIINSFATMTSNPSNGYGSASHQFATWQKLGDSDDADDGLTWATNGGTYGHGDIFVGDTLFLKFDMYRSGSGVHEYDQLKVWLDIDQDYSFDYYTPSESGSWIDRSDSV